MLAVNRMNINSITNGMYRFFLMIIPMIVFILGMCLIMLKNCEKDGVLLKIIIFLIIIFNIIITAWNTDDAYHGFVMSRNWIEGNGLVYNIGERVNASTMPLNTLIQGIMYFICGDMVFGSLFLGIIESGIAVSLILMTFCHCKWKTWLVILAWFSKSLISFSTSGLENSLLFLLAGIFMIIISKKRETFNKQDLFKIALCIGMMAFARMDVILIFLPISLYAFFAKKSKDITFSQCILIGIVGILPFIIWEAFSLFYYGFLFPNTAYAKLGTGYAETEYWIRGLSYFVATLLADSIVVGIQLIFIYLAFKSKVVQYWCVAIGIILYNIYLLHIGGDFMLGRHFTVTAIVSLCGILALCQNEYKSKDTLTIVMLGMVFFSTTTSGLLSQHFLWPSDHGIAFSGAVADERQYYFNQTSLLSKLEILPYNDNEQWHTDEISQIEKSDIKGKVINWAPGILRYYYARDKVIEDPHALGDAFLTKLKAIDEGESWRIGHMSRIVPDGYNETLATGENRIVNPSLHEYYNKLSLIIKGDLLSFERLKTIIDMNCGKYNYLLDQYYQDEAHY